MGRKINLLKVTTDVAPRASTRDPYGIVCTMRAKIVDSIALRLIA